MLRAGGLASFPSCCFVKPWEVTHGLSALVWGAHDSHCALFGEAFRRVDRATG